MTIDTNTAVREIEKVLATYCRSVDSRDEELFRSVWDSEAIYDVGGLFETYVGIDQIVGGIETIWTTFAETHHWTSNIVATVEDDGTARSVCNGLAHMVDNNGKFVVCAFDYTDRLVHTDGRWLLSSRTITTHYLREASAPLYAG